jgi:exosortase E/protease (VPEID-CTERM system)
LVLRAGLLLLLVVAEVLGLTLHFDGEDLAKRPQWWAWWLGEAGVLLRGGLAFVAAFLLVASPRLHGIAGALARASTGNRWWRHWLSLHLAAVGAFWVCSVQLFEGGAESTWWVAGWLAAAGVAPILWLLSLASGRYWGALAKQEHRTLMLAVLVGAAAAASARVTQTLWNRLAAATFWCVEQLLGLVYSPIVSVPSEQILGTSTFQVAISPECSGYEGIVLICLFLSLYLWLFRRALRFPHALLLLPVGVLAIWLSNVVRITTLIAIGTSISPGVALGGFHSQAGWLFFLSVSLGLMAAGHGLRLFAALPLPQPEAPSPRGASDAAALLVPALVLLASIIVTSAASSGFDRWYPLRLVATAAALWHFRAAYRGFDWQWTWQSAGIGVTVFIMWLALETSRGASGSEVEAGLAQLAPVGTGLWLASRILGSIITVPLAEEFAFRGYLTRKLVSPAFETVRLGQFTWLSFLGSSVAFGFLHGRWIAGTLAGMAYAVALYRRGQIGDAVYAHMTTNALIAAYVLSAGRWSLWS